MNRAQGGSANILTSTRVHFVGIGGAGMSAIAKVLLERGIEISGSDLKRSRAATTLEAMGADVHIGHAAANVAGAGVVVVSSAIPERNPELAAARARGLHVVHRGQALADLLADSRSIVVAGTHGKTTTTSMIVSVLRSAGLDPTYLVGGGLNDSGTNGRFGRDEWAVAESDESDGSFLLLSPHVAVVTNVELDHVDYWGSSREYHKGFARFLERVDPGGVIVAPAQDEELLSTARASKATVLTFGFAEDADVRADDIELAEGAVFVLEHAGRRHGVHLGVPGLYNVANALAAAGAATAAGVGLSDIARGLDLYTGVERRFQRRGEARGVTVVDDYAHNPTKVRSVLGAARNGPWRRVVAVFQPHRYSRTLAFESDFGGAFEDADRIVVTDVYGAGEEPIPGVTGKVVADAVCASWPGRRVAYLPHRAELIDYLVRSADTGDVLLTLGAGDITSVGDEVLARLNGAGL